MESLGLIAGSGAYPLLLARAARRQGVRKIVAAAFEKETDPALADLVDTLEWMRVGQLGRLIQFFAAQKVEGAIMAGQIAPANLFDLRPDFKALLLLARLKERNAESIFGAIAAELGGAGTPLLPATRFMEEDVPGPGHIAGPRLSRRARADVIYGFKIAKEISRLDIGQTVLVKKGTVVAVEAFEGTNAAMRRGGALGKGDVVLVKVSKPDQDMRFDVPVIGAQTLQTARESGVTVVACEAGKTLLLDSEKVKQEAETAGISLVAVDASFH